MNQAELRRMAEERLLDADALIVGQRWSFAYYVAGYAVECALKSCLLARMVITGWVFRERNKTDEYRTHDFKELVRLSGMDDLLAQRLEQSSRVAGDKFVQNWSIVLQWKSVDRYDDKKEFETRALLEAITESKDGVLPWIKPYW